MPEKKKICSRTMPPSCGEAADAAGGYLEKSPCSLPSPDTVSFLLSTVRETSGVSFQLAMP